MCEHLVSRPHRAFTLIELLVVIGILAILISVLLPALSGVRKRAAVSKMWADYAPQAKMRAAEEAGTSPAHLPLATIRSLEATVGLTPKLSVGTAEPESIYEAKVSARIQASGGKDGGASEVHLPLPPQIISLADLEVTVNNEPSESVSLRGDRLVWAGNLPGERTPITVAYSAVGKGIYSLQMPASGILEKLQIDLTANGSDVRMLDLSLQPTSLQRGSDRTVYTWAYKRLLFGRPIALDVLGIAPIDRLGELTWLGPGSVVVFGLLLGLVGKAYEVQRIDRWLLLLILGTFTGAYPLMYFMQEFVSLTTAILVSAGLVVVILGIRSMTLIGAPLGFFGVVLPSAGIMALTLVAAVRPGWQGLILTGTGLGLFIVAMLLFPRIKLEMPGGKQS